MDTTYIVAAQDNHTILYAQQSDDIGWHEMAGNGVSQTVRDARIAEAQSAGMPYDVIEMTESGSLGHRSWTRRRIGGTAQIVKVN